MLLVRESDSRLQTSDFRLQTSEVVGGALKVAD